MCILPKKKIYEPTIFDKRNALTENEGNKCKYYTSDQLNDLGLKKHVKNVSNAFEYVIFAVSY